MKTGEPKRRSALPTLTLLFAIGTFASLPSAAQTVLEARPGAARIHLSAGRSLQVALAPGRVPRAAAAAEGGHFVAGEDRAAADLFFVYHAAGASIELPLPAKRDGVERARPVLLTRFDRLDGAVWLEGSGGGLAVVAAAWNGSSWERVETIAPANGRPQLAPAAAVLADGSWLAVWAGFDGGDDEIFWSARSPADGSWSAPRRVHTDNRVPDLLPALTSAAAGSEAVAAWSFYDGNDYRVRAARFDGRRWQVDEPLPGRGAADAAWQQAGGRAFLVYRAVAPEVWTAVELDAAGGVLHRVTRPGSEDLPPLVAAAAGTAAPRLVPARRAATGAPR